MKTAKIFLKDHKVLDLKDVVSVDTANQNSEFITFWSEAGLLLAAKKGEVVYFTLSEQDG